MRCPEFPVPLPKVQCMSLDLDISSLLKPFDGEFRGGTDLREDDDPNNDYRQIRDARNAAREEERLADVNGQSSAGAWNLWREVWENGQEYLKTCAKDLEIVAYMIEASIRIDGFSGFARSLDLTRELVEAFWGELLPAPDEEGIETTLRPISRLNGEVITYPLMRVAITEDKSDGALRVWQYDQAKHLATLSAEEQQDRIGRGAVTVDAFKRAVAESSPAFFRGLAGDLETAKVAVNALQAALEEKAGDADAPNLSRFHKSLEDAESTLRQIAAHHLEAADYTDTESSESGSGSAETSGGGSSAPRGALSSRNDALELLEKAAAWFEQNEPQSILPSEIRKAIRRGRMSPQELYMDLIADDEIRRQLFRDVGIVIPEE